jgi:hemolysin III
MLRRLREPVNGLTHGIAALVSVAGLALLIYLARDGRPPVLAALIVYGITLILVFSASATYHMVDAGPRAMLFLRKLDHSAIYLLIAGSYTPVCLHFFEGFWRWGMIAIIWSLALVGVGVKLFVIHAPRWVTAGVYLFMGWLSIIAAKQIVTLLPPAALAWLLLGGLFFSVGAVIYMVKKPDLWPGVFGFHEVWHIFVILGAFSHYVVMAAFIAPVA